MGAAVADFLSPDDVFIDLAAPDKTRALQVLSYRAAAKLGLDESVVANEILGREALGSTGVGKGIAIPHARLSSLHRPFAMAARLKRAIEFDAIDGEPVDLVILLLMPDDHDAGQISLLAAIARKLRGEKVLTDLRKARSPTEIYEVFRAD
jgi:PTS system nitrogen regulatory IIA component